MQDEITVEAMMFPVPVWEGMEKFLRAVVEIEQTETTDAIRGRLSEELELLKERTGWQAVE